MHNAQQMSQEQSPRNDATLGSVVPIVEYASEAGHYYLPDGTPFYSVPNKSKPGKFRPVTITDARKVGAVPSVTTVTGLIKGEGLINYIRKQVFQATLACPYALKDETPEAHMARALAMAEQHKEKAAERGTSLHADIEHYMSSTGLVTDKWMPHINKLVDTLKQLAIDLNDGSPEKSFAHPLGFGGKCDWHCGSDPGDLTMPPIEAIVIDFKSKDSIEPGKRYAYDEHAMQVASYAIGLGLGIRATRCINVFIGEQDERILVHEWPEADLQSAWEQFKHLLAVWQIRKKYWPTFGPELQDEQ